MRRDALAWWIPLLGSSLVCLTTLALDSVNYAGAITVAADHAFFDEDPFARLFPGEVVQTDLFCHVPPPAGPAIERYTGVAWPGGAFYRPYASSSRSQISLRVGNDGYGVPQTVERHLADDRDRRRVDELGDVGADERRADEHAPRLVDDEPRRVRARRGRRSCRRRRRTVSWSTARASIPAAERGGERVPDRGDLRVGEDDARRRAPAREIVEPRVAAEDRVGGDPRPGTCPCA